MKSVIGIGLILLHNESLLTVRERESKPQYYKEAGMLSFPLETFEEEDGDFRGTINRLLCEELGISREEVELWGMAPENFRLIPGRTDVEIYYGVGIFRGDPARSFHPKGDDVDVVGWKTPAELMAEDPIRIEVVPILKDFSKKSREDFF